MEKLGKYLFDTSSESMKQYLSDISKDDIRDCCNYLIFLRGEDYSRDGMVEEISWNEKKNELSARVEGRERYKLKFYQDHMEVRASCSCPYDDVCKHMVAVLLQIIQKRPEIIVEVAPGEPSPKESEAIIRKSLKSLSQKELSELVMKFASIEYLEAIRKRNAPEIDAKAIFKKN